MLNEQKHCKCKYNNIKMLSAWDRPGKDLKLSNAMQTVVC